MKLLLSPEFYQQLTLEMAQKLLGKTLVHKSPFGVTAGIIVETEAYIGPDDKAAHSYKNRHTKRTQAMFGPAGHAYVFTIYGIHNCFNVVSGPEGCPEAILIRALEPTVGLELMKKRRKQERVLNLTNGPGKLTQAMNITKKQYGWNLISSPLFIGKGRTIKDHEISHGKRIGIDYAEEAVDFPWRFYLKDNKFVSK